jgi:tetratricopeptide (TPR) repeat protein
MSRISSALGLRSRPRLWPTLALACLTAAAGCSGGRGDEAALEHHRNLGKAHFENGETDEAIAEFQTCIALSSGDVSDRIRLAKAYFLAKKNEEAVAAFLEAQKDAPELPDIPYDLGILYKRMGRTQEGIGQLERLLQLDPECLEGWYNLGTLYQLAGGDEGALRCYRKVVDADPMNLAAHYRINTVARKLGDRALADSSLRAFTEMKERTPGEELTSEALEESPYFEIDVRRPGESRKPETGRASPQPKAGRTAPGSEAGRNFPQPEAARPAPRVQFAEAPELLGGLPAGDRYADAIFLDADGDADADLFLLRFPTDADASPGRLCLNDGAGRLRSTSFAGVAGKETATGAGGRPRVAGPSGRAISCAAGDADNDGDLDLYVVRRGSNSLYRNEGPEGSGIRFTDVTDSARIGDPGLGTCAVFADYDHDGDLDLFVANVPEGAGAAAETGTTVGAGASRHATGKGAAESRTSPGAGGTGTGATRDSGEAAFSVLYRNNGAPEPGSGVNFTATTRDAWMPDSARVRAVVSRDLDNDQDTDLAWLEPDGTVRLFSNIGQQRYREIESSIPAAREGADGTSPQQPKRGSPEGEGDSGGDASSAPGTPARALEAGDLTGDGWEDLVVASTTGIDLWINQGGFRFAHADQDSSFGDLHGGVIEAVHLLDADDDGDLDLLAAVTLPASGAARSGGAVGTTSSGAGAASPGGTSLTGGGTATPGKTRLRYLRNDGRGGFTDASSEVGLDGIALDSGSTGSAAGGAVWIRSDDVDGDGDPDVLVLCAGRPILLRNDGGSAGASVRLSLIGGKSNRRGTGAVVEARDGDFFVRRTVDQTPLTLGLGDRDHLDYLRISWPSRIVQNEVDVDLAARPSIEVMEKAEALGSCPSLYAWNGDTFEFVTDVLATTSVGLALDGKEPMAFDDEELIRIPPEMLRENDGEYRFRVTEELDEIVYLDRVELIAIDHPDDVAVYSNTILRDPPFPDAAPVAVRHERPPVSAVTDGGIDCLAEIAATDTLYAAHFRPLPAQYHGMCNEHSIEMDLGPGVDPAATALVIRAWMDWPETATFLCVAQNEGIELILPTVEVRENAGWRTLAVFGIQALKPKEVVVDLRGKLRPGERILRLRTNLNTCGAGLPRARGAPASVRRRAGALRLRPGRPQATLEGLSGPVHPLRGRAAARHRMGRSLRDLEHGG